jgi:hypothetical protein
MRTQNKTKLSVPNEKFRADSKKENHLITLLQEKMIAPLRINPWLAWFIIGEIFGGIAYLAVLVSHGVMTWIGQLAFMYAIVFTIAGAGPIWVRDELEKLLPAFNVFVNLSSNKIKQWYSNELKKVFLSTGMVITGIVFSILAMASFVYMTKCYTEPTTWWGTPLGNWTVTIVVSVLTFLLGMDLYLIARLALLVHHIPNLPLQMTIYQHPSTSISAVGTVMQKFTTVCAITLGLVSLTAIPLSPFKYQAGMILIGWLTFAGCVVVAFFIFPQYRLHIAMSNAKANKIRTFSKTLSIELDKAIKHPTSDQIAYVKEAFEIYQHLIEMPEWPFNTRSFLSLLSAVIIPILLSIIQQLIKN